MTTLEEYIERANSRGYLINNLFQLSSTQWRCSLRKPLLDEREDFYEFGDGHDASAAVDVAIFNADTIQNYSHMVARKKVIRS